MRLMILSQLSRFVPMALGAAIVFLCLAVPDPARAADRARIEAFLNVTGFDVALDSIAESAESAPVMLGLEAGSFGIEWQRLAADVFDTAAMRVTAVNILEQTLSDEMLIEAVDFYASDLGQRLVASENETYRTGDAEKRAEGERLFADMVATGSPRPEIYTRMSQAIDGAETGLRAMQEIQVRFLLAASAAGVIDLKVDADGLRASIKAQEPSMRLAMRQSAMTSAAYTYREFSEAELLAYAVALEKPNMRRVYELLNAVQYEIMAGRFEMLATRMAGLQPQQDL